MVITWKLLFSGENEPLVGGIKIWWGESAGGGLFLVREG